MFGLESSSGLHPLSRSKLRSRLCVFAAGSSVASGDGERDLAQFLVAEESSHHGAAEARDLADAAGEAQFLQVRPGS